MTGGSDYGRSDPQGIISYRVFNNRGLLSRTILNHQTGNPDTQLTASGDRVQQDRTVILDYTYSYDRLGNPTQRTDSTALGKERNLQARSYRKTCRLEPNR